MKVKELVEKLSKYEHQDQDLCIGIHGDETSRIICKSINFVLVGEIHAENKCLLVLEGDIKISRDLMNES